MRRRRERKRRGGRRRRGGCSSPSEGRRRRPRVRDVSSNVSSVRSKVGAPLLLRGGGEDLESVSHFLLCVTHYLNHFTTYATDITTDVTYLSVALLTLFYTA
jgi:hypothetical protein